MSIVSRVFLFFFWCLINPTQLSLRIMVKHVTMLQLTRFNSHSMFTFYE
ncbi:unnamed protein product, partial [Brassica oleracea var. botrytis]